MSARNGRGLPGGLSRTELLVVFTCELTLTHGLLSTEEPVIQLAKENLGFTLLLLTRDEGQIPRNVA